MKVTVVGLISFALGAVGGAAAALIVWEHFERRFDFSRIVTELESGRIGVGSSSRPLVGLGKPRATWVRPGDNRFSCEMY